MNKHETNFLQESIRIGDDLLKKAIGENDFHWKTFSRSYTNHNLILTVDESLYSGVSGIAFFLLKLYQSTHDFRYLDAAQKSAVWLQRHCKENPTNFYSLYSGRMGVVFFFVELLKITKEEKYKQFIIEVALESNRFINENLEYKNPCDLINGASGSLLALLHLHSITQDNRLMSIMDLFISHLLKRIKFGKMGIYWDFSPQDKHSLCGFAHGTAGIGYVFLELGHYFQNSVFFWVSEQAFIYENFHFDNQFLNWPDFRDKLNEVNTVDLHKEQYSKCNLSFFTRGSDMAAWCHGASGIGLSRIRAYSLLRNTVYMDDLLRAAEKILRAQSGQINKMDSFTLCHGACGDAIMLLEAFELSDNQLYYEHAKEIGYKALTQKKETGKYTPGYFPNEYSVEDLSLFMGSAGIGYFYLLLIDKKLRHNNILKPQLDKIFNGKKEGIINIGYKELNTLLFAKLYPRCVSISMHKDIIFTEELGVNPKVRITQILRDFVSKQKNPMLSDIFYFEKLKIRATDNIVSNSYLRIRSIVERENFTKAKTLMTRIRVHSDVIVWNLREDCSKSLQLQNDEEAIAIVPTNEGIKEVPLKTLANLILKKAYVTKTIQSVIEQIALELEISQTELRDLVLNQIKELVNFGVIHIITD